VVGGTGALAPLSAALISLLNQQRGSNIGFANPTLYQNAGNGFTMSPRATMAAIRRDQAGTPAPVLAPPTETSCRKFSR
jgi:hypothetical protein